VYACHPYHIPILEDHNGSLLFQSGALICNKDFN
jgi:hypothetical protein